MIIKTIKKTTGKDDELTAMVPVAGKVVALDDVSDPTFASGKMGAGVAIVPSDGKVYAPFDGVVKTVFVTPSQLKQRSDQQHRWR